MRYNMESLDLALDTILPNLATAKKAGVQFDRPTLIRNASHKFFLDKEYEDRRDFNRNMCYHVIWEAAKDLDKLGYFEFGQFELALN
jgi:hypothetical protein